MLATLSIRDIVLIDSLDLEFERGLSVLSGETGAGKSILLDALALALGARGDAGLVRHGAGQGSVTAAFSLSSETKFSELLDDYGIAYDGEIVLRRVQYSDGRTRGFLNDQPVGVKLMREVGRRLVEIHGQHDERALLDPAAHLALVDAFGGHAGEFESVAAAWRNLHEAEAALTAHEAETARSLADAEYLRHASEELTVLAAEEGEEVRLADQRKLMVEGERVTEDLARAHEALAGEGGGAARLTTAAAALERAAARAGGLVDGVISALSRAEAELSEATHGLEQVISGAEADPVRLEAVEERLFALRAVARKHGLGVDELPAFATRLAERLSAIEGGEEELGRLRAARDALRADYLERAGSLTACRVDAAHRLDAAVMAELAPLKLEAAHFATALEVVDESRAGPNGLDRAEFMIATNPGTPEGPLRRVASGGELTRVMLALKVALAGRGGAPTLIFDEIDSGVGGAVADAVGERLQRLGAALQVLVVTHSPQVAARGDDHLLIEKEPVPGDAEQPPNTKVRRLGGDDRREEIARMLAGASVTEEARAAAGRLIGSNRS